MLSLSELVAPLQLIATLVNEVEECKKICGHVHQRLVVINDTLLAMEKKKTLLSNDVVRDYSSLVMDFQALLAKHKSRLWVYRVVMSRRVIADVKDFQERIDTLMLALGVIHISAMADARAAIARFLATEQRTIVAQLTDDATVTQAVAHVEEQLEAQSVLMHELRKNDRRSASTTTLTITAAADDDVLDMTAANERLITTALDKVIRRSTVHVRAVPVWFCAAHDVEYKTKAFAGGSFGTVHYGRMHDKDVVVKCLRVDTRTNATATTQFRDEATLWFGFRHPHVLRMYSACDVSSPPFIVCELAANGNLFNFLSFAQHKPLTFRLLHQATLGLAYLHAQNVVHGDLKGDNILVTADKCAKIADFSFSYVRAMSASRYSKAQASTVGGDGDGSRRAGALRWRAPECLKGRSPTLASDVFSFGMCILEVVSQAVPWGYRVDDVTVRFLAMAGELPERPSNVTDRVWDLVTRMCSLDPKHRPSLASVTTELSDMAKNAELAIGSASVDVDTTMSGVASMTISSRDDTPVTAASVAFHSTLSPVPTPKTLEEAITQDDVACASRMLSSAASTSEMVDGWNAPPLIVAAATGATKVTEMLLARGADAATRIQTNGFSYNFKLPRLDRLDWNFTALHIAAVHGHLPVVKALLTFKPDVIRNVTARQCCALHFAAQFGHVDVIEELLRHGVPIDIPGHFDETPLHVAAKNKQIESVRVLLAHNANVNAKSLGDKTTALYFAAISGDGNIEIVRVLLAAGAEVTLRDFKVAKECGRSDVAQLLKPIALPSRWSRLFGG